MEKKYTDERAVELIFDSLQKLKKGKPSLEEFAAFAVGVAMVIDPVPLTGEDMQWAQTVAKTLGLESSEVLPIDSTTGKWRM